MLQTIFIGVFAGAIGAALVKYLDSVAKLSLGTDKNFGNKLAAAMFLLCFTWVFCFMEIL